MNEYFNDLIAYIEGEIRKSEEYLNSPILSKHHEGMISAYKMVLQKIKRMLEAK